MIIGDAEWKARQQAENARLSLMLERMRTALVINGYNVDAAIAAARRRIAAGINERWLRALRELAHDKALRKHGRTHMRSAGQFMRHLRRRLYQPQGE